MSTDELLRAADVAYGTYYSYTDPKFTGKQRAWRGDPERNPLLRPLRAALAILGDVDDGECLEPCCVARREQADGWAMLTELYRVLVRARAGSSQQPHAYSRRRTRPSRGASLSPRPPATSPSSQPPSQDTRP